MNGLIGYNGFVGATILKNFSIQKKFNTKNIIKIHKYNFNTLFCAAPSSLKFYANKYPRRDRDNIIKLINFLKRAKCKKFIHISTIDIYNKKTSSNEDTQIVEKKLYGYGKNRRTLEKFIINKFEDHHILRLPNLIGDNLKKNVVYDIINNKNIFINSNNIQQWYNLKNLKKDLKIILNNKIKCINLVSEPFPIKLIFNKNILNKKQNSYPKLNYNIKSKHSYLFGNKDYIYSKKKILLDILNFIKKKSKKNRS
jgi:hypothetical protein